MVAPAVRLARRPARAVGAAGGVEELVGLWPYLRSGNLSAWLTAPVIYSMLIPFAVLDAWVLVFQAICFRAWGIRPVRRRDYLALDRHRLGYLNNLEKMNCVFCSYANGVLGYVREVAARTEQYWCPIKHGRRLRGTHGRYPAFADYGDGRAYRAQLPRLRAAIKR